MLYIHIPFCHRKCTYCAFYSTVSSGDRQAYVDALCQELRLRRQVMEHPLHTVYWGGGTPSLLSIAQVEQIVATLRECYQTAEVVEATLEANPEDLTPDYLRDLSRIGFFNRISIGVQSFHDDDLRLLNRRHNARQAVEAVRNAVAAGFDNVSVDLIYGLPGQTVEAWQDNLCRLASLPVCHLSAYALTVEDGTMLARQIEEGRVLPADEEQVLLQYAALQQWTGDNGFAQYEVSNYCREGRRAIHNSRYWNRTPYLGVGAAAHSFDGQRRRWNVADVRRYVESVGRGPIAHEEEELGLKDAYNEYVMTALRTVEGIDKGVVPPPFAVRLAQRIHRFIDEGLLVETPTHYRPTAEGLLHADGIAVALFA